LRESENQLFGEIHAPALGGRDGSPDYRAGPLRDYCIGLMMPCERKSVEPIAAVTARERTAAQHQSLLHFVGPGLFNMAAVCLIGSLSDRQSV
jgi:DDE superfamily endonuclease